MLLLRMCSYNIFSSYFQLRSVPEVGKWWHMKLFKNNKHM